MEGMTEDDLKAIEEMWAETTPGIYEFESRGRAGIVTAPDEGVIAEFENEHDALAFASAQTDIPTLIAEVRRLRKAYAYARGLPNADEAVDRSLRIFDL